MKKWLCISFIALLLLASIVTLLTGGFQKGVLSGRIYRPRNVYEEIWNLVLTEEYSEKDTVLTTGTNDSDVDFDFGIEFVGIHIPECNITICWESEGKELCFLFSERLDRNGPYIRFIYNYETQTLIGNTHFSYFMENFISDYFDWCKADREFNSNYDTEALGEYEFVMDPPSV